MDDDCFCSHSAVGLLFSLLVASIAFVVAVGAVLLLAVIVGATWLVRELRSRE